MFRPPGSEEKSLKAARFYKHLAPNGAKIIGHWDGNSLFCWTRKLSQSFVFVGEISCDFVDRFSQVMSPGQSNEQNISEIVLRLI